MELSKNQFKEPLSILLVEGYTEKIFYERVAKVFPSGLTHIIVDIHGGGNMLKSTLASAFPPVLPDENIKIRVYCCKDEQSKYQSVPDFDLETTRNACKKENLKNILSVDAIIANQMIESWFFYDLMGIYNYLGISETKRKPLDKYLTPSDCTNRDLMELFKKYNQYYHEGQKAEKFINSLDIHKIINNCTELKAGVELIKTQSTNTQNHLFV
jgi:hypothetical protein